MGQAINLNLIDPEELDRFEETVGAYLAGELDDDRFVAMRLQQGVYGQRQARVHMVRIKLPGGRLLPRQLVGIAEVVERYAQHQVAHISTRQDFQLHYVPTEATPAVLRRLADYGLTTREACGNTVRNITTCPLAGVCPREHVDVTAHHHAATERFLRHPLTQHLPRKFKISFSGCEADCAQGMMHDVGVVAVKQNGKFGFKVMAGGGLGHKPHQAIVIEPFLEERDLLPCMEAVIALHHRYSDRKRRAKARIKFLVDRFGPDGFIEKYREEYARTKSAYASSDYPKGDWVDASAGPACGAGAPRSPYAQKQAGLFVFPISVTIGDITPPQLRGIAALLDEERLTDIRTTQDQNLIILNVPEARLAHIRARLAELGLTEPRVGDDVVACPGTSTCKLGITSSKIAAGLIDGGPLDLRIRISGCHNSCAQPDTADIGMYGEGRRLFGKLVPHYVLQLGGNGLTGGGLAFDGPEIPVARVVQAVRRIQDDFLSKRSNDQTFFSWSREKGVKYFDELLQDLSTVKEEDMSSVLSDHGETSAFKVLQLGGGECAGANQEQVAASFFEAAYERDCRNAFALERKFAEALECLQAITRLTAKAVLFVAGQKNADPVLDSLPEIVRDAFPDRPALAQQLSDIRQSLIRLESNLDEGPYHGATAKVDAWVRAAAELCQSFDPLLDVSASVPHGQASGPHTRVVPLVPVRGRAAAGTRAV
jgi:sulfite reductase beta subunit-like hemoprotein